VGDERTSDGWYFANLSSSTAKIHPNYYGSIWEGAGEAEQRTASLGRKNPTGTTRQGFWGESDFGIEA
jgi:hypothetical protein